MPIQKVATLLTVMVAANIAGICLMAGIQVLRKKKAAIPWAYASIAAGILWVVFRGLFWVGLKPINLFQALGYSIVWGLYLAKSARVKNTLTIE